MSAESNTPSLAASVHCGGGDHAQDAHIARAKSPEYEASTPPRRAAPLLPGDQNLCHNWRDRVTYQVLSLYNLLKIRPDLSQFDNYISRQAAKRVGAVVQRYSWSAADDPSVIAHYAHVRLTVDFNGLVEDVVAMAIDSMPGDADLILGFAWIRRHDGNHNWSDGRFYLHTEAQSSYLEPLP
ncbi:hypothetical protein AURDEDRAFT_177723 [Auricularia subglabra TFB-10046 SS5]|uniref:Uncharacterized protein n=1 Tax=Auricularia subglabra (strain TFB-10046 / SS5) TaxID=717982 RepID=J0WLJ6_AURST|nr:hypothetical protein AURDEDRAFT_177723 [Auricularia subglabra TFB-10046 SS5]